MNENENLRLEYLERRYSHLLLQINEVSSRLNLLNAQVEDIGVHVMEHDLDSMTSSIISLEQDRIHVKKVEGQIGEIFTELERIEKASRYKELQELKDGTPQERMAVLEGKVRKLETENLHSKLSNPSSASSTHTEHHPHPDLADSLIRLLLACEKHRLRGSCSREKVDPHKPCTSHCTSSDSSQDILSLTHFDVHQTSTVIKSFEQLSIPASSPSFGATRKFNPSFRAVSSLVFPEVNSRT